MTSSSTPAPGASRLPASCTVDGWTIAHGHRPIVAERTVSGHFHPVLRVEGIAAPCFLAGPGRIVLPAFSANAAGCDVLSGPVPREWLDESLRCIASTGSDLLDFGPLPAIRRRQRAADVTRHGLSGLSSRDRGQDARARVGPVHRASWLLEAIVR